MVEMGVFPGDKDRGGVFAPETLRPPFRSRCMMMLRLPRCINKIAELRMKAAPSSNVKLIAMLASFKICGQRYILINHCNDALPSLLCDQWWVGMKDDLQ
jgi:hypothetical protein